MTRKGHTICFVASGSIAEELDIRPGDRLLSINESEIKDIFDYKYLINDEYIEVLIEKEDGNQWVLEIDKETGEDLGVEFENGLMDEYRSCTNKCIFCFIDQMPPYMRETLYFKDDDSRLSFLQGNYITLTNMKQEHIERIIHYRLEPINISIHTTNPKLRCEMLSNRFAGNALSYLKTLYEAEIKMNAQIVLCRGVNDKDELDRTIQDLSDYMPYMESLSVVPVGLTKFRSGLYPLESFTKEEAAEVIRQIESWQNIFYKKSGFHFVHASDEWYILAGKEFPGEERYDGYLQLENGVGMMPLLMEEFKEALSRIGEEPRKGHVTLATGLLAFPSLQNMMSALTQKFPDIRVKVFGITNHFFGEQITVSGLLTGRDIAEQLKEEELGEKLLLPANVLRSGEDVFLDDMAVEELESKLRIKVEIVDTGGEDLLNAVLSKNSVRKKKEDNDTVVYDRFYDRKGEGNE